MEAKSRKIYSSKMTHQRGNIQYDSLNSYGDYTYSILKFNLSMGKHEKQTKRDKNYFSTQ